MGKVRCRSTDLDKHIVWWSKNKWRWGMDSNTSNIVRMSFKLMYPFQSIIIEYTNVHIIRSTDDPIFSWHKFCSTNWQIAHFKGFYALLNKELVLWNTIEWIPVIVYSKREHGQNKASIKAMVQMDEDPPILSDRIERSILVWCLTEVAYSEIISF